MASLTMAWEYLTGYAVATDPTSRDRAEWPPHPAHVFMALAAAWGETEPPEAGDEGRAEWKAEQAALRWLETLGDPEMRLPSVDDDAHRSNVTFYVPVNDRAGPSLATLQSCPAITRSKQARTFPKVWVGEGTCCLHWPDANDAAVHREALARLCRKVTRLGHSSSLVSMRLVDEDDAEKPTELGTRLVRDDLDARHQVRALSHGTLDMLQERFGEEPRRRHASLSQRLGVLKIERKGLTGKGSKERKDELDRQMQSLEIELSGIEPRPPVRPNTGLWTGYREEDRGGASPEAARSLFDSDMLVLAHVDGSQLPLVSTLAVTRALRREILKCTEPAPDWVSGHLPDGQPLRDGQGHLALIPLPHVGHTHADGHLLGVALVFPRSIPHQERGRVFGKMLVDLEGRPKDVKLKIASLDEWTLRKRDWEEQRSALDPDHWTSLVDRRGRRRASTTWASVTPVVLDRFPKHDRSDPQRQGWEAEVHQILREACTRIGLPEPESIRVDTTSRHAGSPRDREAAPPFADSLDSETNAETALGEGFPPYPPKGTNASRPQVHVSLRFALPVFGPVLLGAGRFLGYGLCKPLMEAGT